MDLAESTIGLIKKFTGEHQDFTLPVLPYASASSLVNPSFSAGMDMLNASIGNGLMDFLNVENDLVTRFIDYESQDDSPLISSALDIYADDMSQYDSMTGRTLWVEADDEDVRRELDDLLNKNLRIEDRIWAECRTLCKYGNLYLESVVKDNAGLVAANMIAPPMMRRIEYGPTPEAKGYIYDPTGLFRISTGEFLDKLQSRMQDTPDPFGNTKWNPSNTSIVFEGWEIAHFRLNGKKPNAVYGFGVGDAARALYKRLMLLEDSIIIHRLCLRGDTNVWTTNGYKKISEINEGDEVYCFSSDNLSLKKTNVVYKKHNGTDKIFKVKSKHREIFGNATHPILVETEIHQGSGKPILKKLEYVEIQNLKVGIHKFVTPSVGDEHCSEIVLKLPVVNKKARMKADKIIDPKSIKGLGQIGVSCGVEYGRLRKFLKGERWLKLEAALRVCQSVGLADECLEIIEDWGGLRQVSLPSIVDEDFAMLFGFMIGDGYLGASLHKDGYLAKNKVGIALKDKEEINQKYISLFTKFFGEGYLSYKEDRPNSYSVNSKHLYEFFELNGYISGAKNKRVPEWVYCSKKSIKLAFLNGLVDADGHRKQSRSNGIYDREPSQAVVLEMCNKNLVEDVRELCMQIGLSVGSKVHSRTRDGGHILEGRVMPESTSYTIHFSFSEYEQEREIISVEEINTDDIWDIGVEADEHNFVANGVVVHNTRAPSRFAFYVDVSNVPPDQTSGYLTKVKQALKKQKFINPATGRMDLKFDISSTMDDFFLPTRDGKESTRVETLNGPVYDHIEDVKFFEDKLFAALKVPRAFLTYEESTAKTNLSAEDSRFARTIMRYQREMMNGYRKICNVHLAAKGIHPDSSEFKLKMTIPSAIFELAQLEIRNAELELADKFGAYAPREWIMKNILGFSDEQINDMELMRIREKEAGEQGMEGTMPSGSSGALEQALSKRGSPKAPERGAGGVGGEPIASIAAGESKSSFMKSDEYLTRGLKKNISSLNERIDELKKRDKVFEKKWDRITSLLGDLQQNIGRTR